MDKEQAFVCMMERHEKELLRLCCVYLKDVNMAEDAVQETFLKAYKGMDAFRKESSEKTWLIRIAVNVCRDMRRNAWFRFVDRRVDLEKMQIPQNHALLLSVMELPRKQMEVVLLYYYERMTQKEIASMLGLSDVSVSKRLQKARQRLREEWEGGGTDERG